MRNAERVRAYQMRVSGMTWEAIGRAMHYDGQTIKRDLINSLTVDRKLSAIRFPQNTGSIPSQPPDWRWP